MKTKPYNRHETFLAALTDSGITLPTPCTREELYLAKIAGENVTIPDAPLNRYETYLAKLAGENVSVPTPASRLETFLYMACGYDVDTPTQASREEIFWRRYIGNYTQMKNEEGSIVIENAAPAKAKNIGVTIRPIQTGSGTPSEQNIRSIYGWETVSLRRTGFNLWGGNDMIADIKYNLPNATVDSHNKTVTFSASASQTPNTCMIGVTNDNYICHYIFKKDTRYTFIFAISKDVQESSNMRIVYTDNTSKDIDLSSLEKQTLRVVSPKGKSVKRLQKLYINGKTTLYADECGIFEGVYTVDEYAQYSGNTYVIDVSGAGTVYGGTLDVTTGLLTVTHDVIASYNDEDLPGAWISDRDVYAPGTKPSVGAQVVYELAIPEVYQIAPTEVQMLEGTNNIWSDAGPVSVTYIPDL